MWASMAECYLFHEEVKLSTRQDIQILSRHFSVDMIQSRQEINEERKEEKTSVSLDRLRMLEYI